MAKPLPASLSQKIAQSQLGSGPSLVPQAPAPKQPEPEAAPVHSIDELIGEPEDLQTLVDLIQALVVPQAEMKRLEKIVEHMKDRIKPIVAQYGIDKAKCGEVMLSYYPTSRKTLNATKLMAAGVSQDIITSCTDVTVSHSLKIG